jgi:hypothetical protein
MREAAHPPTYLYNFFVMPVSSPVPRPHRVWELGREVYDFARDVQAASAGEGAGGGRRRALLQTRSYNLLDLFDEFGNPKPELVAGIDWRPQCFGLNESNNQWYPLETSRVTYDRTSGKVLCGEYGTSSTPGGGDRWSIGFGKRVNVVFDPRLDQLALAPNATPTTTPAPSPPAPESALSMPVIIGIAIGGVLVIALLAYFLLRPKRKPQNAGGGDPSQPLMPQGPNPYGNNNFMAPPPPQQYPTPQPPYGGVGQWATPQYNPNAPQRMYAAFNDGGGSVVSRGLASRMATPWDSKPPPPPPAPSTPRGLALPR